MIYFDNNATTPISAKVLERMMPCFTFYYGNASSKTHAAGWQADELVKISRAQVANAIGADDQEIIFTSGATESIMLALEIISENYASKGKHIISCVTEHKAMLDGLLKLEKKGFEINLLPVNSDGNIDIEALESAIRPDTIAVCLMHANNETGLIHPVEKIGQICEKYQTLFISDCTQTAGKISVEVKTMKMAMACFSAHKFHGPKGIGALFISRKYPRVTVNRSKTVGGHESGLRSGTLNVPGIVGMGAALNEYHEQAIKRMNTLLDMRDYFETEIKNNFNVKIHCENVNRLPNTSNICFRDFDHATLIKKLPEIAFSTGSACSSSSNKPSHVLIAMNAIASNTVRFSFGSQNTLEEVKSAIEYMKIKLQ
ncbi:MAG: cysteine desulfurase family protein [Flavobacteriales bacterium]